MTDERRAVVDSVITALADPTRRQLLDPRAVGVHPVEVRLVAALELQQRVGGEDDPGTVRGPVRLPGVHRRRGQSPLARAVGAVGGAYGGLALRKKTIDAIGLIPSGLLEDALAIALAYLIIANA